MLLIEAVTGLLLAEPGLLGQDKTRPPIANFEQNRSDGVRNANPQHTRISQGTLPAGESNILGLAKGLHQGRLGEWNAKWLVDLAAMGMIILTFTGVYIAIPVLRARNGRRDRF